jgi:hypothetical protein
MRSLPWEGRADARPIVVYSFLSKNQGNATLFSSKNTAINLISAEPHETCGSRDAGDAGKKMIRYYRVELSINFNVPILRRGVVLLNKNSCIPFPASPAPLLPHVSCGSALMKKTETFLKKTQRKL